jgi:hypothetical protein
MLISDEDREWIDVRADQLFRESERLRGGIRPNTVMPQDYRDYFVVQAAWERAADAMIEAERRGAERMRERAARLMIDLGHVSESGETLALEIHALSLTEEAPDADA